MTERQSLENTLRPGGKQARESRRTDRVHCTRDGLVAALLKHLDRPTRHELVTAMKYRVAAAGGDGGALEAIEQDLRVRVVAQIEIVKADVYIGNPYGARLRSLTEHGVCNGRKKERGNEQRADGH